MFATNRDARPGLRLVDLGLAMPLDPLHGGVQARPLGAPAYMAPEQLGGRWRDWGPPLDLYALGCAVWEVVTGVVPFRGANVQAIRRAQRRGTPGALRPLVAVPEGLEGWLRRMLHTQPEGRFPTAAAAAEALDLLSAPAPVLGWTPPRDDEEVLEPLVPWVGDRYLPVVLLSTGEREAGALPDEALLRAPDRVAQAQARVRGSLLPMLGAASALEPLRRPELHAREPERRALWDALLRARELNPTGVALWGPEGAGATRLAAWIAERAGQLGLAQVVWVDLPEHPGAALGEVTRAALGLRGLRGAGLEERLRQWVRALGGDDWLVLALGELVEPRPEERPALAPAAVRLDAARELLALLAQRGPLVLVLDEAGRAPEATALARLLLREPGLPVLVVATGVEPSALAPSQLAPPVVALPLGALPVEAHRALCLRLAEGDEELAAELERRSGGLPGDTVRLRQSWLALGRLALTESGFVAETSEAPLPEGPAAALAALDEVLRGLPDGVEALVALAAVVGEPVEPALWANAAASLGVAPWTPALPRRLAEAGVLRAAGEGWCFADPGLRRAVLTRAAGQAELLHLAAARGLAVTEPEPERLASHLLRAGRGAEAAGPLLAAARRARLADDPARALALLHTWAGLEPAEDAGGRVERALALAALGRPEALAEAEAAAAGAGHRAAPAARVLAELRRAGGDLPGARQALEQALAGVGEGPTAERAEVLGALAAQQLAEGALEGARAAWTEALTCAETARALPVALAALTWLGYDAARQGEAARAEALHQRALTHALVLGDRLGEAHAYNGLAELARAQGELDRAEACYRRALYLLELLRVAAASSVQLNLGLVRLRQRAWEEADRLLAEAARGLTVQGRSGFDALTGLFRLPCAAAQGDWAGVEARLEPLAPLLRPGGLVDPDVAWSLLSAGQLAAAQAQPALALRLVRAAGSQWKALGRGEELAHAQRLIDELKTNV